MHAALYARASETSTSRHQSPTLVNLVEVQPAQCAQIQRGVGGVMLISRFLPSSRHQRTLPETVMCWNASEGRCGLFAGFGKCGHMPVNLLLGGMGLFRFEGSGVTDAPNRFNAITDPRRGQGASSKGIQGVRDKRSRWIGIEVALSEWFEHGRRRILRSMRS